MCGVSPKQLVVAELPCELGRIERTSIITAAFCKTRSAFCSADILRLYFYFDWFGIHRRNGRRENDETIVAGNLYSKCIFRSNYKWTQIQCTVCLLWNPIFVEINE